MNKTKICIIILNYNGLEDTKKCLRSVLQTKYKDFQTVIVDNGSKMNEGEILAKEFKHPRITFVRNERNLGFAKGNNEIIKKTKTEYIILLNNDTRVDKMWISELLKIMESNKNIAAVAAKIRSMDKPNYFEYAGAAGGFLDKLGYPYARGRVGFFVEKDKGQYDSVSNLLWASGTCLLLRKKHLPKDEVFPNDFFFYHEETDLCLRLKALGKSIVFAPKAVVYHKGGSTSKKDMKKRIFYTHRNSLYLISRNFPLSRLIWVLPLRLLLEPLSSFYYISKGDPMLVVPLFLAIYNFLYKFPSILYKRRLRKTGYWNDTLFYPFSIYWEYFVARRRKYSQIVVNNSLPNKL